MARELVDKEDPDSLFEWFDPLEGQEKLAILQKDAQNLQIKIA